MTGKSEVRIGTIVQGGNKASNCYLQQGYTKAFATPEDSDIVVKLDLVFRALVLRR
jgi:hypothetical protein